MWSGGSTANLRVECRLAREDLARGGVFAIAAIIPSETIGDWSDVAMPELEIMSCRRFNLAREDLHNTLNPGLTSEQKKDYTL